MDKRNLLLVFLSQFDLTSKKMEEIISFMKEPSISCFAKTKFPKEIIKPDSYQIMLASADEKLTEKSKWKVFSVWDVNKGALVTMKMSGKCNDNQLKETLELEKNYAKKLLNTIKKIVEKQYTH